MHLLGTMSARPFTKDEYLTLTSSLADQDRFRDRLLIVLSCATGFRIKEVLSLTVGQVLDPATAEVVREVTIARRNMKGGRGLWQRSVRGRRVPLGEPVRLAIRDYLATLGEPDPAAALFATCKSRGKPMARSQAFRIIVGAAEECGIDATRISTHSGRKTFAARVYEATGKDLIATQRLMGHTSPMTTARYLETNTAHLDSVVLALCA